MRHIFIINPECGIADKTEQIRAVLDKRDDIEAIVFNTEEASHETAIVSDMIDIFDDEVIRICICGGSGTLSNAIDAIDMDEMKNVEISYFPCGLTNDFLKNFRDMGMKFDNLNAVIDGNPRYIDYMRCVINGDTNNIRNEILFATVGVAANIEHIATRLKFLGEVSPALLYGIGTVLSMPFSPSIDYEVIIDGKDYSREYKMIYVGNSLCLGGGFVPIKTDISCVDGYINVLLIKRIPPHQCLQYVKEFMHGVLVDKRVDSTELIKCKEVFIRRKDGKPMVINADGEIHTDFSWDIKVVSGRLKFVVPENTDFISDTDALMTGLGLNK